MSEPIRAYSLGYEGTTLGRYIEVLKLHEITIVIDVRETPWSYKPGFSKKALSEALESSGIDYVHVRSAGNPSRNRKNGLPQSEVLELYKKHLSEDPTCLPLIDYIISTGLGRGSACLLCFERDAHDCHRKVILDVLAEFMGSLVPCHLSAPLESSKKQIVQKRIPKSDDGEARRKHVKISKDESRTMFV